MSPTMSDDTLVRELTERADRAMPSMSLDPVGVLAAGRRHRRQQTTIRSVGGLALVAVAAVGALQLGGYDSAPPPATTSTIGSLVVRVPTDVRVVVPTEVRLVEPGPGSTEPIRAVDLGVPVSEFDETPDAGPSTYAVMIANLTVEADPAPALYLGSVRTDGSFDPRGAGGLTGTIPASAASPTGFVIGSDHHAAGLGVLPPGFDGAAVELVVVQAGSEQAIDVPTFEVPGLDAKAYFFVADDPEVPTVRWPDMYVRMTAPDGSVSQWGLNGYEPPDAAATTLEVRVATGPQVVDSSQGPVLDLGLPVLNEFARPTTDGREELTYAVLATTWGKATGDVTDPEAAAEAVTVAARKPFGALTPMSTTRLPDARADGSPTLAASTSNTTDMYALGLLPDGATAATLVVQRASGDERITLPTFTVAGLANEHAFFFFTLHDEVEDVAHAPASIELVGADGSVTIWSLSGDQLYPLTVSVEE